MPSLAGRIDDASLRALSDDETFARGRELAGRVRMSAFAPFRAAGTVESGEEPVSVELTATAEGLAWACSAGDASPAFVCPHVVALGIETRRRFAGRRP